MKKERLKEVVLSVLLILAFIFIVLLVIYVCHLTLKFFGMVHLIVTVAEFSLLLFASILIFYLGYITRKVKEQQIEEEYPLIDNNLLGGKHMRWKKHGKEIDNKTLLYENFMNQKCFEIAVLEKEEYFNRKYPDCSIHEKRHKRGITIVVYEKKTP